MSVLRQHRRSLYLRPSPHLRRPTNNSVELRLIILRGFHLPYKQIPSLLCVRVCSCYLGGKFAPGRGRLNGDREPTHSFRTGSFAMPARPEAAAAAQTREERIEAVMKELRPKIEATVQRMVERPWTCRRRRSLRHRLRVPRRRFGSANEVRQASVASRKKGYVGCSVTCEHCSYAATPLVPAASARDDLMGPSGCNGLITTAAGVGGASCPTTRRWARRMRSAPA